MTKTYTQCVSGDNLSLENIFGIIIIQLQLKKCGETLNVASNARRLKGLKQKKRGRFMSIMCQ